MFKKISPISVLALAVLFSGAFAQAQLDVIYRDFPVTADGFEEFMGCDAAGNSISTSTYFEDNVYNWEGRGTELRYGACNGGTDNGKKGYQNGPDRLNCTGFSWNNPIRVTRGMVGTYLNYDVPCSEEDIMEDPEGLNRKFITHRYCARPTPGNANCSSNNNPGNKVEEWFTSGGNAKEIRDAITLEPKGGGFYEINYNANTSKDWAGDGPDGGFFPLDKYDGDNTTWGRQNINVWCEDGGTETGICDALGWGTGGPRTYPDRARQVAESRGILNRLHNYGFSAAGSGTFKYNENYNDVFEFIGDDDMWIFIDGVLAADLGGVHLAAPAKINIKEYAKKQGPWSDREGEIWQNGTTHSVNFFYMDRNTDGSNFRLYMSLFGLSVSRFGAPRIMDSKTIVNPDGTRETKIWVNTKLDMNVMQSFVGTDDFPIIIKVGNDIRGYRLGSITFTKSDGNKGYIYTITGQVCGNSKTDCSGYVISSGTEVLSFNVVGEDKLIDGGFTAPPGFELPMGRDVKSENGTPATVKSWGPHTATLPPIDFKPIPGDPNPIKPPFNVETWFTGDPNGGNAVVGNLPGFEGGNIFQGINGIWNPSTGTFDPLPNGRDNSGVHGFGTVGTPIPPNRAGELILTAYPNASGTVNTIDGQVPYSEWEKNDLYQRLFGLPPTAYEGDKPYGVADPSVQQPNGGYLFVKNGFPNESSAGGFQVAPTRCISDLNDPQKPRINCLNFSLKAAQPFQLAVTVYDQLGNFVTQYRETVSEQEFRSVVQAPGLVNTDVANELVENSSDASCSAVPSPESFGKENVVTLNGYVKVNVNIYPFSTNGRRFGNGVYLVKVDRVDLPYKGCMNTIQLDDENEPVKPVAETITLPFVRYHADAKFGWMRSAPKK